MLKDLCDLSQTEGSILVENELKMETKNIVGILKKTKVGEHTQFPS